MSGSHVKDYESVEPNDDADLPKLAIGFVVAGSSGTIAVVKPNGAEVTIPATIAQVGQIVPFPVRRIKATGTTATNIWVMY